MNVDFQVQHPKSRTNETLKGVINACLAKEKHEELLVAVAYMTVSGLRALLMSFSSEPPVRSKWLVGLDDYVTQPGAISVIKKIPGAEVKVVSYNKLGFRFHPKLYIFKKDLNEMSSGFLVLGSSNLTAPAFLNNGEANSLISFDSPSDYKKIKNLWSSLWSQGHIPTSAELLNYKKVYEKKKTRRPRIEKVKAETAGMIILSSDEAELDPTEAKLCWIECGNITAQGREIELKAEQGLFFGLNPGGEESKHFNFVVSSGKIVQLRIKYQNNHMWRLQLSNIVPEVEKGLRPVLPNGKLGRSPYIAIFQRTDAEKIYKLRFIRINSQEFKEIVKNLFVQVHMEKQQLANMVGAKEVFYATLRIKLDW